ncbi:hypothetical protein HDU98_008017 [Podochytrium sp. JEL0797]|nr:hypothetical protein HDU98_008017 [Podochytrium sp. JEL0797]
MTTLDLIHSATLTASSTSLCTTTSCQVTNIRASSPDDLSTHLTLWQSALDPTCSPQWIYADWSTQGAYTPVSFSILYGPLGFTFDGPKITHNLTLTSSTGELVDAIASGLVLCSLTSVIDSGNVVRYDLCSFKTGGMAGMTGANFTWDLVEPGGGGGCQMNIHEISLIAHPFSASGDIPALGPIVGGVGNGLASLPSDSTAALSPGAIAGIVICALIGVAVASVCWMRQMNLAKRRRAGRYLNGGGGRGSRDEFFLTG